MGVRIDELDDVDASTGGRETPDDGDYNVVVTQAEFGPNAKRNGSGYKMKYTILDGPFKGNEVFEWINVTHENDQAANIGRAHLKALMLLTGVQDSDEMVGKSVRMRLVGELSDYVSKNGNKTKIVNLRPKIIMDLEGKNAKGEKVAEFVPSSDNAKAQLAEWRANNTRDTANQTGGAINRSSATKHSADIDDDPDIPF